MFSVVSGMVGGSTHLVLQTYSVIAALFCIVINGFENIRVEKINGESAK